MLVAGEKVLINTTKFQNDMTSMNSADDILTLLVHLGYLTYRDTSNAGTGEVWIPNSEIQQEFINSIEDGGWKEVIKSIHMSDELLNATLNSDEEKVAEYLDKSHSDNTSILQYNNENSLHTIQQERIILYTENFQSEKDLLTLCFCHVQIAVCLLL